MDDRQSFLMPEQRGDTYVSAEMKHVWKVELDIVEEFVKICKKYGLQYSLAGGTLIGAFRHGGFIPWDDDIDLEMPREDYDKFLDVAQSELPAHLFLQTTKTDPGRVVNFAQIRNSNTTCIDPHWVELGVAFNAGIGIDIFPVDGVPDSKVRYFTTKWLVRICQSLQYNSQIRKNFGLKGFLKRYMAKVLCAGIGWKNLYEIREWALRRNKMSECERSGEFSYAISMRNPRLIWSTACYDSYIDVQFEYLTLKAAVGYDEMNRTQYGDWMTPVKGTGDHGGLYYDVKRPYSRYFAGKIIGVSGSMVDMKIERKKLAKCRKLFEVFKGGNGGKYYYCIEKRRNNWFTEMRQGGRTYVYVAVKQEMPVLMAVVRFFKDGSVYVSGSIENDRNDLYWNKNASQDELGEGFRLLLGRLKADGASKLVWRYLKEGSPFAGILPGLGATMGKPRSNIKIEFDGLNHEQYFGKLKKHVRQNIRTAYNRLKRDLKKTELILYSTERIGEKSQISLGYVKAFIEAVSLYEKRQEEKYGRKYALRRRLSELLHWGLEARKYWFIALLKIDGAVMAICCGLAINHKKELWATRLAIDKEYGKYSPGLILVNELIKKMMEDTRYTCLNLGQGDETYKYDMGGVADSTRDWELVIHE